MIYSTANGVFENMRNPRFILIVFVVLSVAMAMAPQVFAQGKEIDASLQLKIINTVASALHEKYVFPNLTEKLEAHLRDRYNSGAYQNISSGRAFARALSNDLLAISDDLHLKVYYCPDEYFSSRFDDEPDEEEMARRLKKGQRDNFTFRRVEILPGNVGYLKFDRFPKAKDAAPTAIAALNFLGHCDALIIDLRDNGGGEPNMVRMMMSYFFDEETHFNSLYNASEDETTQLWTQEYVEGPRLSECDIYVLISFDTFSAGESMAYNLKHSGRAKVIGALTPGGAHDCEFQNFPDLNIVVKVPYRRAISPFTGTNWEGVGVKPDIETPAYKAYDVAYLEAVKGIRASTTDEERLAELDWVLPVLEANLSPVFVSEDVLKSYVGVYDPIKVTYDHGTLLAQDFNRRPMKLIAMSQSMFRCQWMDDYRLEFHTGADGKTDSLTAYMNDGSVFPLSRSK